jgi:hypothetical protein
MRRAEVTLGCAGARVRRRSSEFVFNMLYNKVSGINLSQQGDSY